MRIAAAFTIADVRYIEANFICLRSRPEGYPAPSYRLEDGREFYPLSYLESETNEERFKSRLAAASEREGTTPLDPGETWEAYMDGIYGVCLKAPSPETIARKSALLQRIEALTAAPNEDDAAWRIALKHAVDALDDLEQPFSPHYDRARFGRPPTRDTHVTAVRRRYLL